MAAYLFNRIVIRLAKLFLKLLPGLGVVRVSSGRCHQAHQGQEILHCFSSNSQYPLNLCYL